MSLLVSLLLITSSVAGEMVAEWDSAKKYEACLIEPSNSSDLPYRPESLQQTSSRMLKLAMSRCVPEFALLKISFGSGHAEKIARLIHKRVEIFFYTEIHFSMANES